MVPWSDIHINWSFIVNNFEVFFNEVSNVKLSKVSDFLNVDGQNYQKIGGRTIFKLLTQSYLSQL